MLTKDEWNRHAEVAAAHKFGEDHASWYIFKRYGLVPTAVVGAGVLLGGGGYWFWHALRVPGLGTGPGQLPALFWVFATALGGATFYAFRPGRFVTAAAGLVKAIVFSLLWLGIVVYGLTVLI